ncbi:MAG: chromosomal replication initiator protein DnaA [Deltaproteobacteria bacterium]|nr:chromosomal replication initiator protein DnaA [Deltaproteobacteria bacterium]
MTPRRLGPPPADPRPAARVPAPPAGNASSGAPAARVLAAMLERLSLRMSLFAFRGFLEPLRPSSFGPGADGAPELVLAAPTVFLRDWARDHYLEELSREAAVAVGAPVRVQLVVAADPSAPSAAGAALDPGVGTVPEETVAGESFAGETVVSTAGAAAPEELSAASSFASAPARPSQAVRSGTGVVAFRAPRERPNRLSPRNTFESFVTGPSNRMAYAACTAVAEHPGARYSPLFLFGGTGLGKTHLLQAIGNEALARHPNLRVAYLSAEQWVNEYIADIQAKRFEDFRRRYRDGCDLLLIDDIQFLAGKNASQDEFFHTFNALYEAHKQIVVTSDRYPHEIAGLEERLKTRLQWGLVADVQPPEIETRLAILEQKAHGLGCALPVDVAEYLATTVTSSVRELEGALVRLSAFSQITREPITLSGAREQLRPMLALKSAEVPVARVIDVVATYYGLRSKDLVGPSRQRQVTRARQVAMFLVRQHLGRSLPEIGRAFGDRDHTTVLASVNKIGGLKEGDAGIQAVLSRLSQSLFGS